VLLAFLTCLAYHNSLSGPFIFDDKSAITENPTIYKIWPLTNVLMPPRDSGVTVNGRPVLNLTLALNYAVGGEDVTGYHLANLTIHLLAGLTLFGLLRRTFLLPRLAPKLGGLADLTAFTASLLWLLHPLQTEAVTYVVQRAESLVGLFYLLTLYAFIRSVAPGANRTGWQLATFAACVLGMATKEVMVSAPLIVFLFDVTLVAGSFGEAWRQRRWHHATLASTWLLLLAFVVSTGGRGGTVGFGIAGLSWWNYLLTQARAIGIYLKLSFWPHPLIFDYGLNTERQVLNVLPQGLALLALFGASVYAVIRRSAWGLLGISFFAILAPSSSVIPIVTEPMAEHRMYLPLATVLVAITVVVAIKLGRQALWVLISFALVCGVLTVQRNFDYQDEMRLWQDNARKAPLNYRAHNNVGEILYRRKDLAGAVEQFQRAILLEPTYLDALSNLGNVLAQTGHLDESVQILERAIRLKPTHAEAHSNLGNALYALGREEEAITHFEQSLAIKPNYAEAHNNLGVLLAKRGKVDLAIQHYEQAMKLKKDYVDLLYNFGNALGEIGRDAEARKHYAEALRLDPKMASVHNNWGKLEFMRGNLALALAHFQAAVSLDANYIDALNNLGVALFQTGKTEEAIRSIRRALELNPQAEDARRNLESILKSAPPATPATAR
jgi:Flp pilus assembly protein TadD